MLSGLAPPDNCASSSDYVLLAHSPPNRESLLVLLERQHSEISEPKRFVNSRQEAWFLDSVDGSLLLCSYVRSPNPCGQDIHYADFVANDEGYGNWSSDGLFSYDMPISER